MKKLSNKIGLILIALIFIGMSYTAYSFFFNNAVSEVSAIERIDGQDPIQLADYIGVKKTILQFVAVPCECCAYSMPFVKEFVETQDEIDVITIVFSGTEGEILDKFLNEYEVEHVWGVDLKRDLAFKYEVKWSPTYVFYDKDGTRLGTYPYIIGTAEELEQRFQEAYDDYYGKQES